MGTGKHEWSDKRDSYEGKKWVGWDGTQWKVGGNSGREMGRKIR